MLKIGLVGIGRGKMIQTLQNRNDLKFAAACDIKFDSDIFRSEFISEWRTNGISFSKLYSDFNRFLEHELDVVLICTPPYLHARQSIQALESGRHVICEVPATMNIEESKKLVQAVKQSGKKYFFAENCCYWAFVQAWKKIIADGRLGDPFLLEGEYIHDLSHLVKGGNNCPTWRYDFEPIRYSTHETGPLLDMINDKACSVVAMTSDTLSKPEYQQPNAATAIIKTNGNKLIRLLISFKNAANEYHRYMVLGTQGSLETKTNDDITYATFSDIPHLKGQAKLPIGIIESGLSAEKNHWHGSADWRMLDTFINDIIKDLPPSIDVYKALDYSLPGICAVESIEKGSIPIKIPNPRFF